ncbi:hypothetical protein [Sphingomonas sp. VNH70]|uniref:hypothetical protein n=1 Tax=Sphingomonas silueang TaxID=3156617 RepID=UPI0032B5AC8D
MVSIGTVWDKTVDFVRDHGRTVVPVVLATQFAPTLVSNSLAPLRIGAGAGTSAGLGLVSLLTTLVALWGALYLVGYAAQPTRAESAAEARAIATGRFLPLIGVSLVLLIGVSVLAIPGVALALRSGIDPVALSNGVSATPEQLAALGPAILYFALLGIVLLWLFARLLPLNAVVAQERRGIGAIGRAFALTRGMALKLVGLLLLYGIVTGVAVLAVQSVLGVVFGLILGPPTSFGASAIVVAAGVAAVSAALALYQSVFVGKLYRSIVGERDEASVFA